MTGEDARCKVRINGMNLVLPVHIDLETTEKLAAELESRLQRIESESGHIDTQRFAIQAAYELAAERYDLEEQYLEESKALIKALEKLTAEFKGLIKRFHLAPPPGTNTE